MSFFNQFFGVGIPIDGNLVHESKGGSFEPENECQIASNQQNQNQAQAAQGGNAGFKLCCGEHPNRTPFQTFGGGRACCGNLTYSVLLLQCCFDNDGNANGTVGINESCT